FLSIGLCRAWWPVDRLYPTGQSDLNMVNLQGQRHIRAGSRLVVPLGMPAGGWRRLSPSAELMVDPRSGARCAIRDTRAADEERYYWTVTVIGEPDPVATARIGDIGDEQERLGGRNGI